MQKIIMYSNLFFIILIFMAGGCAATSCCGSIARAMINDHAIGVGMPRQEAKNILGGKVTIGYEITGDKPPQLKPISLKSPLRVELYRSDHKVYEAEFYFTALKHQDGVITDDELTPLVFENDRLIGRGWEFYVHFKKENHL